MRKWGIVVRGESGVFDFGTKDKKKGGWRMSE